MGEDDHLMSKEKSKRVDCSLCGGSNDTFLYHDYQNNRYVRCNICSLVYQNPRETTRYEENFWQSTIDPDGKTRNLLEEKEDKIRNRYASDINFIHKLAPGKILDVGCGPGFFLSAINNRWDKYGTDISEFTTNFARTHFPEIKTFTGELFQAKYDDNFFDVVYCFSVMEHVGNHAEILEEIYRVTKPNGILIVSTPNIESICAKRFKGNYRLLGKAHIVLWSKKTLTMLLEKKGFEPFNVRFPFFGTKYFSIRNMIRMMDTQKVSPPFYGNEMTVYAAKVLGRNNS